MLPAGEAREAAAVPQRLAVAVVSLSLRVSNSMLRFENCGSTGKPQQGFSADLYYRVGSA